MKMTVIKKGTIKRGLETIKKEYSNKEIQKWEMVKYLSAVAEMFDKILEQMYLYQIGKDEPEQAIDIIIKYNKLIDKVNNIADKIATDHKKPLPVNKTYADYLKQAEFIYKFYYSE